MENGMQLSLDSQPLVQKLFLPLTALIVSRDHKTSFLVHDLLKLVGLVKQSWVGAEVAYVVSCVQAMNDNAVCHG